MPSYNFAKQYDVTMTSCNATSHEVCQVPVRTLFEIQPHPLAKKILERERNGTFS